MANRNYRYLVVFEGRSAEVALTSLFSSSGLSSLNKFFNEITAAKFYADYGGWTHLYELKS